MYYYLTLMCRCINCFITWHNLLRVERGYRRYKIYELSLHYRFKSHASGGDGKKKMKKNNTARVERECAGRAGGG